MLRQDRFSFYALFVLFIASLGGLLFGYHTAVISGVLAPLKKTFSLTVLEEGLVVSTVLLGGLVGSFFAGPLADKWGRKKALLITALIFSVGGVGLTISFSYGSLLFGRFITGVAVGLASVISPLYLAEISPPNFRGRFVCMFQLMLAGGFCLLTG